LYSHKFPDRQGSILFFLENCHSQPIVNLEDLQSRILGFFEIADRWQKDSIPLNWKITFNQPDTYSVQINQLKTTSSSSGMLNAIGLVKSKIDS